jgi:hypothetical protein
MFLLDPKNKSHLDWLVRTIMKVVVSVLLLFLAIAVILSNSSDGGTKEWAFGLVGFVSGAWLTRHQ